MNWADKARRMASGGGTRLRQIESAAGWPVGTLKSAMSAGTNPSVRKAIGLARALGVSVEWLFDDAMGWDDRPNSASGDSQQTDKLADRELIGVAARALDLLAARSATR